MHLRAIVAALLFLVLSFASPAQTQRDFVPKWDSRFAVPGVDEWVGAMAFDKKEIYLGGFFHSVGPIITRSLAHYDGKDWSAVPGEPQIEWPLLNVIALEIFKNTLYVGGYFTNAGGQSAGGLAALKNKHWSIPRVTNGTVFALRTHGDSLLVGGRFTPPGFTNPVALARYDGRRWTDLNSELPPCEDVVCVNDVSAIQPVGRTIFSAVTVYVNAWPYIGPGWVLARYDEETGWFGMDKPGGDELGWFQLIEFGGELVYGGAFTNSTNAALRNIARWDGSEWQTFGKGLPGEVFSLAANRDALYALHRVDFGPPRSSRVSCWRNGEWTTVGTNDFLWSDPIKIFLDPDGAPYVTGIIHGIGDIAAPGLMRWNGTNWAPLFSGKAFQGPSGGVRTISTFARHQRDVFMGGIFLAAGDRVTQGIARWDGEQWHDVGGGIDGNPAHRAEALHSSGNLLWAGGSFTNIGGTLCSNIAAWNGTNWLAAGPGVDDRVVTLTDWRDDIYAGGRFTRSGEQQMNHIARWDGIAWHPLSSGCDGNVLALIGWNDRLVVGGSFTNAGGQASPALASWNGIAWEPVGGGVGGTDRNRVSRLAVGSNGLYVAGSFRTAGAISVTNIARWDGAHWHSVGAGFDGVIGALTTWDQEVFLAGRRTNDLGETTESGVYRLVKNRWELLPDGPAHPGGPRFVQIQALLPGEHELFVGGRFTWAGNRPSASIARWIAPPSGRLFITRRHDSLFLSADAPLGDVRFQTSTNLRDWIDLPAEASTKYPTPTAAPSQFFRAVIHP